MTTFVDGDILFAELCAVKEQIIHCAFAETTWNNLNSAFHRYINFLTDMGLDGTRSLVSWYILHLYVAHLAVTMKSPDCVKNYVSLLKQMLVLKGVDAQIFDDHILRTMLCGLNRFMKHRVKPAVPVTPDLSREMFQHVDTANVQQLVTWVATLLGFYLFLHKSNLVPVSKNKVDALQILLQQDICTNAHDYLVYIKWTKIRQAGSQEFWLLLLSNSDPIVCLVYWLTRMLAIIPASPQFPLLGMWDKHKNYQPLTYNMFRRILAKWMKAAGITGRCTPHGLRHGGATWAFAQGIALDAIKKMGDWYSDAYLKYIDISLDSCIDMMQNLHV